jgi:hypothetical protein
VEALGTNDKHSFNRKIQQLREESRLSCEYIYRALSRIYPLDQNLKSGHCSVETFYEFFDLFRQSRTLSDNVRLEISVLDL